MASGKQNILEKFGEFAKLNGLPDSEAYFIWE